MCYCVICGKKLRPFKTTREWKDRNTHLNCKVRKNKKAKNNLRYWVEQYKMICRFDDWDYDYENNKIIDKRI